MALPGLSILVPVHNSERSLPELHRRLTTCLAPLGTEIELVLVDDGSTDRSWEALSELARQDSRVRAIRLGRNFGQHNALLCAIRAARFDVIVTIDDDLQNPPEEIPRLLAQLAAGQDVVYGTPEVQQHGLLRNLASRITKLALQDVMGSETARKVSPFRVFRTCLRDAFAGYGGSFVSIDVLLSWSTTRFAALPVRHDPRAFGTSNYTFGRLVTHALNMMTGFSALPLQVASLIGVGFTALGAVLLVYVLARYVLEGGVVPGFPFLASVMTLFSGAQLLCLGVIGEYLARMHFRMMDRPVYYVRSESPAAAGAPPPPQPE